MILPFYGILLHFLLCLCFTHSVSPFLSTNVFCLNFFTNPHNEYYTLTLSDTQAIFYLPRIFLVIYVFRVCLLYIFMTCIVTELTSGT